MKSSSSQRWQPPAPSPPPPPRPSQQRQLQQQQLPPAAKGEPGATVFQNIAFVLVYRKAFISFLVGPVLVLALPLSVKLLDFLLSYWRDGSGYGYLILILFVPFYLGLTLLVQSQTSHYEQVMAQSEWKYILEAFLASLTFVAFLVPSLSHFLGISLEWTPNLLPFVRFAMVLILLEILVLARYIGPQSIMRCSSFPLVVNPLERYMRQFYGEPILTLLGPSETSGGIFTTTTTSTLYRRGRRFQHPTFLAVVAQFFFAVFAAVAISILFGYDQYSSLLGYTVVTCLPLLSLIGGNAHELDPDLYTSVTTNSVLYDPITLITLVLLLVVPAATHALVSITTLAPVELVSWQWTFDTLQLYPGLALVHVSLYLFDQLFRRVLFFEPEFDEVIFVTLQCLLQEESLVQRTLERDSRKQVGDLEAQELSQMDSLITDMGLNMTCKVENRIEAPLEEDILRYTVLYSLGGGANIDGTVPVPQRKMILKHVHGKHGIYVTQGEPDLIFLVRGLCVFAGGFGEALRIAFEKRNRKDEEQWSVPPGARAEIVFALRAITRCFGLVFVYSSIATQTQLEILLPAVLTAIFRLRLGISLVRSFENLLQECDKAAALIVAAKPITPQQILSFPVERPVMEWIQKCVGKN